MGKNDTKKTYEAPFIELVPYADQVMEEFHGAVSLVWEGHPDENPYKPVEEPPPGGWGEWTAKGWDGSDKDFNFGWDE
ncbi:MAG: hypothetical protein IJ605_06295 [Prevotella sp.]|nr:hypothetical protein [Prevotella sp.]